MSQEGRISPPKCVVFVLRVCVCAFVLRQRKSPGRLSAPPDRADGALRSAAGAEDPPVSRTDPMCVWHSFGAINVIVRPPSLQSRLTPLSRAPSCCCRRCFRRERKIHRKINKSPRKIGFVSLIDWRGDWLVWFGLIGLIEEGKGYSFLPPPEFANSFVLESSQIQLLKNINLLNMLCII